MGNDELLGLPSYGIILNQRGVFYVNDILDQFLKPYLSCQLCAQRDCHVYVDSIQFYIASVFILWAFQIFGPTEKTNLLSDHQNRATHC